MSTAAAKFTVGQLVSHSLFHYRGVIVDVDPCFMGGEEWYEQVARTRPPKDKPWYHVLVHNGTHDTYVAERNLQTDPEGTPINHPSVSRYFAQFSGGRYIPRARSN